MTPTRADQWRAWGSSLILHASVLLSLTAVVIQPPREEWLSSTIVESRLDDSLSNPVSFIPSVNLSEFLSESGSPGTGPKLDDLLNSAPMGDGPNMSIPIGSLMGIGGTGGVGNGGGGLGAKMGAGNGVGFFGSRGTAEAVVFVVDMSGSMENGRFVRAQQELARSIRKLNSSQYFYVIFFTKQAVPMFFPTPAKDLVPATSLMKRKAIRWIVERRTGAGTDPEEALVLALSLQPDVIYFLTDGEFSQRCRDVIKEKNTFGTVVNTIALQSREGVPLLKDIANDNKGVFLFVK